MAYNLSPACATVLFGTACGTAKLVLLRPALI